LAAYTAFVGRLVGGPDKSVDEATNLPIGGSALRPNSGSTATRPTASIN
jgi:hypothetical protein